MIEKNKSTHGLGTIKIVWGLLCSMSSIDIETRNISLTNVINQINVPAQVLKEKTERKLKAVVMDHRHELVLLFRRVGPTGLEQQDIMTDVKATLFDSAGNEVSEILSPMVFPATGKNYGHRVYIPAFTVTVEGDYEYRVALFNQQENTFTEPLLSVPFSVVSV